MDRTTEEGAARPTTTTEVVEGEAPAATSGPVAGGLRSAARAVLTHKQAADFVLGGLATVTAVLFTNPIEVRTSPSLRPHLATPLSAELPSLRCCREMR
jgi:hypothetical protein